MTVAVVPGRVHGLTSVDTQEATLDAIEGWVARHVRLMHVIDSLAASGGAENRLVDEALALAERHPGIRQSLVRLFASDDLAPRLEAAGIPVLALGFDSKAAARIWPLAARRLRAILRDRRPTSCTPPCGPGNLVGQLAAAPLGIPVVSTFNRSGDLRPPAGVQPGVARWRGVDAGCGPRRRPAGATCTTEP